MLKRMPIMIKKPMSVYHGDPKNIPEEDLIYMEIEENPEVKK